MPGETFLLEYLSSEYLPKDPHPAAHIAILSMIYDISFIEPKVKNERKRTAAARVNQTALPIVALKTSFV